MTRAVLAETRASMLLVLLLGGAGKACVIEPSVAPPIGVVVTGPPPEPIREPRPAAPSPRMVWVTGYWHWTGMQYTWIPGHWEEGRDGTVWRGPDYVVRDGKYFYQPGGWTTR
jgi:hypothetical protein